MKVLIIGGGGREHAIALSLSKSAAVSKIYCAPGNAGIAQIAECVPIQATAIDKLLDFALAQTIDFTVVGMDDPLVMGVVDLFEEKGLKIFGPRKNAAIIEGSKVFSKNLMKKYQIPTAQYECFDCSKDALDYVQNCRYPVVIKVDGLALGKGVLICATKKEAKDAVNAIMIEKKFGEAGDAVVIEEFLLGREVSLLAFCDGQTILPMVSSQDYKKAYDGNQGPNTGGMGTISPSDFYTLKLHEECMERVFLPTVQAMAKEGRPFQGVLYFGLILTNDGVKVLEYNARFGDPETQVLLPRLKTDLLEIMMAVQSGTLDKINLEWADEVACCVVLASGGYPQAYAKGIEITGLDQGFEDQVFVYHAGTAQKEDKTVTNGGRVLGVTALGATKADAVKRAYANADRIQFEGKQYRTDIGS